MIEEQLRDAFSRHEAEVPPADPLVSRIDAAARRRRSRRRFLGAGAATMAVVMIVAIAPSVIADRFTKDIPQANFIPGNLEGKNLDGAINFLLVGLDERPNSTDPIRADSIMIVHIPASHDKAFLISLPRDAEVEIPAFPATNFSGGLDRINAAFAFGARKPDGAPDDSQDGRGRGMNLMMQTINQLVPGGIRFSGAAIINFTGFRAVLNAIGGVDLCVDVETRSIHYDNKNRYHNDVVPRDLRKVYPVGCRHFNDWEALDYARQRQFDDGDYGRQRHHQQLLMAIFKKLTSEGILTDPSKLNQLQVSAGGLLTLDLGGSSMLDWVFTLSKLSAQDIVLIKTNGGKFSPGKVDPVKQSFNDESMLMLKALHDDTLADFLSTHPSWVISPSKN